jgi:hypothetical protein
MDNGNENIVAENGGECALQIVKRRMKLPVSNFVIAAKAVKDCPNIYIT